MRVFRHALIAALLSAPVLASAQTIQGVVLEDETRTPIGGAMVELVSGDGERIAWAETSTAGSFVLRTSRSGSFRLQASHLAFVTVRSDVITVRAGETLSVELNMAQRAIPVEPVEVTAPPSARLADFYERQRRGIAGRFVTRADIEARPGTHRPTDLLRGIPGVEIAEFGTSGTPTQVITMRGGAGRCLPTVYINGSVVRQYAPGSRVEFPGMDDLVTLDKLEGVEVYTSIATVPATLPSRDGCGVVAFWTRTPAPGRWSWKKFAIGAGLFGLLFLIWR